MYSVNIPDPATHTIIWPAEVQTPSMSTWEIGSSMVRNGIRELDAMTGLGLTALAGSAISAGKAIQELRAGNGKQALKWAAISTVAFGAGVFGLSNLYRKVTTIASKEDFTKEDYTHYLHYNIQNYNAYGEKIGEPQTAFSVDCYQSPATEMLCHVERHQMCRA